MSEHPPSTMTTEIKLDEELLQKSTRHMNIAQEFIITTTDKLKLCLLENRDVLKAKISWIAPFGILITLVTALVTADFKKTILGLTPHVWQSVFIISSILCFIWLIIALLRICRLRDKGDIESVVKKLKQNSLENISK